MAPRGRAQPEKSPSRPRTRPIPALNHNHNQWNAMKVDIPLGNKIGPIPFSSSFFFAPYFSVRPSPRSFAEEEESRENRFFFLLLGSIQLPAQDGYQHPEGNRCRCCLSLLGQVFPDPLFITKGRGDDGAELVPFGWSPFAQFRLKLVMMAALLR